jgi:hypothetical protein
MFKTVLKKIETSMLTLVALWLSTTLSVAKAEDVVALCNGCTSAQIEKAALQSKTYPGTVHVVDFTTGVTKSFRVEHDYEPGFEFHTATPITPPSEIANAARTVNELVSDVIANGGTYNKASNILTRTVLIPSSIASTSTDVRDIFIREEVSEHLRKRYARTLLSQLQVAWQAVVQKIIFQVNAKFADGSTATYVFNSLYVSTGAFLLNWDTIRDKDGKPALNDGVGGAGSGVDGGESYSFGDSYSGGTTQRLALQCRSYTITTSGGYGWSGSNCWFVGIP